MTYEEAVEWVLDHLEDPERDEDMVFMAYQALFQKEPTAEDLREGLWSQCVDMVRPMRVEETCAPDWLAQVHEILQTTDTMTPVCLIAISRVTNRVVIIKSNAVDWPELGQAIKVALETVEGGEENEPGDEDVF